MDKLVKILPLLTAIVALTVYAENNYVKESELRPSLQTIQVERYQDKINFLRYKETHGTITPDQKWELEYYKDKKVNILKSGN